MRLGWLVSVILVVFFMAGCGSGDRSKPVSDQPKGSVKNESEKPGGEPNQSGGGSQPEKPNNQPSKDTNQPETASYQTIKIHDESIIKDSPIINIIYPQIDGMKDKGAQDQINAILKKKANSTDEKQMTNDDPSMPPSFYSKYKITFQNDHLISFVYDQYLYLSGAAHGMPVLVPILVDLDNGKIVEPNEFFTGSNPNQTKQLISQLILKQDVLHTLDSMGEFAQISTEDLKQVYLTRDGLVMYFPPYEYASFAEGTLQYHLSFSDLQSLLNAAFFKSHGIEISQLTNSTTTVYFSEGYHFSIPKTWFDRLIFERADYEQNNPWFAEMNVYYHSPDKPLLFSVHMYEKQVWTSLNLGTEFKLTEDSEIIYSYSAVQSPQTNLQANEFIKNVLPGMMKTFQLE